MPVCRWQEERRKRYPTDANVAKRASEASARRQRGELDPEAEARQLRLHEVIARQQELGLLKVSATELVCMLSTFLLQVLSIAARGQETRAAAWAAASGCGPAGPVQICRPVGQRNRKSGFQHNYGCEFIYRLHN